MDIHYQPNQTNQTNLTNLTKYMFRQRTLELLYFVKNFDKIFETNDFYNSDANDNDYDYDDINNNNNNNNNSAKQQNKHNQMITMKKTLSEFITVIKMYIKAQTELSEEDTDFMSTLCDDILVAHNTLGKPTSNMYCGLRQHSQGRERSYNCQVPLDYNYNNDTPPPLGRHSLLRQYAQQLNTPHRPVLTRAHTSPSQREVINIVSANSYSDEDLAGLNGEEEA